MEFQIILAGAIVNPVSDQRPKRDHPTLNANQQTTIRRSRALGLICWYCRSVYAVTDSSDGTSDDELSQRGRPWLRSDLNYDTQDHNGSSQHHCAPPSQKIAKREDEDSAEEAAYAYA